MQPLVFRDLVEALPDLARIVPLGNRPFYPGKRPPYKPDVPCYTNKLPNLNGPAAAKTPPTTVQNPGATR